MSSPVCDDAEFIRVWNALKSGPRVAKHLGVAATNVARRRRSIEKRHGISLVTEDACKRAAYDTIPTFEQRVLTSLQDGYAIVFSDAHYWPGEPTLAHEALLKLCRTLKPKIVIANGDVFDGARISRHPPNGWENAPSVIQELKAVKERLGEVQRAAKGARLMRTRGNHDIRFERHLAVNSPEFREVQGFTLADHLPDWPESWSVWINDDVVVKHRAANGIHAIYNNVLKGGMSIVTGHLHSLKVTPWTDYRGTRYGVDTGSLADVWGEQFSYAEDGARNWISGFAVLSFRNSVLLPPELCSVTPQGAVFRGEVVCPRKVA